jgi:hypothetical protein
VPRYYFNIREGSELIRDEEGTELPDPEAAHAEALASARDLAMDEIRRHNRVDGRKIEIVSEFGDVIDMIAVREGVD